MHQYIAKRVLLFIPTIILVTLVVFLAMRIIPGDPALLILGGGPEGGAYYTEEQLAKLRHELGTDRALHVQYGLWMWDMFRGKMGNSIRYKTPIINDLKDRAPVSIELAVMAILISFLIGVPLGVISALAQDTMFDYVARIIALIGIAVPVFVAGLLTIYILTRLFGWIPFNYRPPWEDLGANLSHMIFPALALGFHITAFISRMTRSSTLEVLREDYIRTARAKGLKEMRVVFLHALQNAFLPIITMTAWAFGLMLSGSVIIESIFVLPGLGSLMLTAITFRDYPTIQAVVVIVALFVLVLNLLTDLLYAWLDPRIRFA